MSKFLMAACACFIYRTDNPVKMSMGILIMVVAMFALMSMKSGMSWFPMVFMLLFTGGILIMFMILSSLEPNQGAMKIQKIPLSLIILIFNYLLVSTTQKEEMGALEEYIKVFFQNPSSSVLSTMLIILYFTMFIKVLKKEKNSMRMSMCQN